VLTWRTKVISQRMRLKPWMRKHQKKMDQCKKDGYVMNYGTKVSADHEGFELCNNKRGGSKKRGRYVLLS
jgi:hypothetical protein